MARQHLLAVQGQMILDPAAGKREKVIKDGPHRQDGRARIDRACGTVHAAHLAARSLRRLYHGNRMARMGQPDGGCEAANSSADHHDAHPGVLWPGHGLIVDSGGQTVQYDLHFAV